MFSRGPSTGVGQPAASTSGRGAGQHRTAVVCNYGGLAPPPLRRPGADGNSAGASASRDRPPPPPPPPSINVPRAVSPGYTGPRLVARPDLAGVSARQAAEARGRVVFDDGDARMAAYDAMDVAVAVLGGGGVAPAAAGNGRDGGGGGNGGDAAAAAGGVAAPAAAAQGAWDADEHALHSFNDLGAPRSLLQRMKRARLNRPTPIQSAAIPVLQAGRDLVLAAPPGSGATAAYLVPLLQALHRNQRRATRGRALPPALVLAPSRELAQQVASEAVRLSEGGRLKVVCATGGAEVAPQRLALARGGCDLLVATPGRLLGLAQRRAVSLANLRWLVLEEAEALLGPGLDAAVRGVLALRPGAAAGGGGSGDAPLQTVVVGSSAADAGALCIAAADLLRPGAVAIAGAMPGGAAASPAAPAGAQRIVGVAAKLKPRALLRLLSDAGDAAAPASGAGGGVLVCCGSAASAGRVHAALEAAGVPAGLLHGRRSQAERDEALQCFRFGVTRVLVACGAAARGLDLPDVAHLVNYEPPGDEVDYAKRLARLGRGGLAAGGGVSGGGGGGSGGGAAGGGGSCTATTLVCPEDAPSAAALARALRAAGAAPPEWLDEMAEQHAAAVAGGARGGRSEDGDGIGAEGPQRDGQLPENEGWPAAAGWCGGGGGRLFTLLRPYGAARLGAYLPPDVGEGRRGEASTPPAGTAESEALRVPREGEPAARSA